MLKGQISKFISPGSMIIDVQCSSSLNCTGALTPDNNIIVVVMNQNDDPETFQLVYGALYAEYTIPDHGITTFVFPKQD